MVIKLGCGVQSIEAENEQMLDDDDGDGDDLSLAHFYSNSSPYIFLFLADHYIEF